MRVLLVVDDWAARDEREPAGAGARAARTLAERLTRAGHDVVVLAAELGSGEPRIEARSESPRVLRLVRTDAAPGHWQRTSSAAAARLVRETVRSEQPDIVHVLSWRGLTRDLVAIASSERAVVVVSLLDPWFACLVGDRIRRDTRTACDAPLGPSPCLTCAELDAGPTPWVPIEARFMAVAERRRDMERELTLARAVILAPGLDADAVRRALSSPLTAVEFHTPGDVDALLDVYACALRRGPVEPAPPAPEWFAERMQTEAEKAWDDAFARATAEVRR